MKHRTALTALLAAAAALTLAAPALAQTKLKWAHVYETSEPFHKWSVWAADEIKKRSGGRYQIDVFPASQLGKENDINQGLSLGTVDIIISGSSFAAKGFPRIGVTYYPYTFRGVEHLLAYTKSDIYKELTAGYEQKSGNEIVATDPGKLWNKIKGVSGNAYTWPASTYIAEPPFFAHFAIDKGAESAGGMGVEGQNDAKLPSVMGARVMALFGDSITTDHISPAGSIKQSSPAGQWLMQHGVMKQDFNAGVVQW